MITRRIIVCALLLLGLSVEANALDIKTWKTTNGVEVLFLQAHDLPIVDLRISFAAASSRDGALPGLSLLVNSLLVEGTGKLTTQDIALQFEQVGAQLGAQSSRDMARISLRSLSAVEKLNPVVELFAQVIALPAFPPAALERDRADLITNLSEQKNRIGSVVSNTFMQNLYAGHPYQFGPSGTEGALSRITREDLIRFHQRFYVAENASLAIVGDLTFTEAKAYSEKVVQHLPKGNAVDDLPRPEPGQGKTIRVPFETEQTQIKIGMPVFLRHDPDYYILTLGNHILGGNGSNSRLMQKIREQRGLSYSVYSSLTPLAVAGPFEMGLQTRNHQVEEALLLLEEMLGEFIDEGPTETELAMAKKNITGGFALRLDSNRKLLNQLSVIGFYDLPLDYLQQYPQKIQSVTAEDIRHVFKKRLKPEQMIRVIVGPDEVEANGKS